MKKIINKIVCSIIVIMLIVPFSLSLPQKAEALFGVGDIVFDPTNTVQSTITAANTTASSFSLYSMQFKEFVLDGIAGMFAKQIIHQITQSVVNWINSGFEGSPSFVTNPSSFFLDLADQETGRFLAKYGGPLTNLCSPFSIDLRIALAFKYHPNIPQRYTCTLGTIITNSKNAVKGASINGFTAGDFSQGGWPAFVSLTTEPQNNIYGAWLEADNELSLRVANLQIQRREELNQGKGFLSWRKCTKSFNATGSEGSETSFVDHELGNNSDPNRIETNTPTEHAGQECEIQTPGSVIAGALESNLGSGVRQLELADELNEIVNALFAQLVTQVLSQGLGAVSGSGSGDSNAYINKIIQESPEGASKITDQMLPNLATYIENTRQYKANKDGSLNSILEAKIAYNAAQSCFERNSSPSQAAQVQVIIARDVTPLATRLLGEARDADAKLKTLIDIQASSTAAKTVNDLRGPSEKYSQIIQSQTAISPRSVQDSKEELDQVKTTSANLKQDAQRWLQQCTVSGTM